MRDKRTMHRLIPAITEQSVNQGATSMTPVKQVLVERSDCLERIKGALVGFAVGDALGAPIEFKKDYAVVTDFQLSLSKRLQPGQYTDDTQFLFMSLDAAIEHGGQPDSNDLAKRLLHWYDGGEARSVGRTTRRAIENIKQGMAPHKSGIQEQMAAGASPLCRVLPFSIYSALMPHKKKLHRGHLADITDITHRNKKVLDMCDLLHYYVQGLTHGCGTYDTACEIINENAFLNKRQRHKLRNIIEAVDTNKDASETLDWLGNSGFVESVLHSASYCAMKAGDFRKGVLLAVNAGGDSDTRGAITGAFLGLTYGYKGIPEEWRTRVEDHVLLVEKAKALYDKAANH